MIADERFDPESFIACCQAIRILNTSKTALNFARKQTTCSNLSIRWKWVSILEKLKHKSTTKPKSWPTTWFTMISLRKSFCRYITGQNSLWIRSSGEKGFIKLILQVLRTKSSTLYSQVRKKKAMIEDTLNLLWGALSSNLRTPGGQVSYGATSQSKTRGSSIIMNQPTGWCARKYQHRSLEELDWLGKMILEKTPKVLVVDPATLCSIFDGLFHLFIPRRRWFGWWSEKVQEKTAALARDD